MFVGRAIVVLVVLVLGLVPATALATPQDVAATNAYIRAYYTLARASDAKVGVAQAKMEELNRKLGRECPNVGAGAPQDEASQPLSYEAVVALWSVAYGADAGPIGAFVDTIRRLRWSDGRLTRIAQNYATSLHDLATLPIPDLCGDVGAWKASGFQTIPVATTTLDRRAEAIYAKSIPARLLAPYEQPGDRAILARAMRLETKLEEFEISTGLGDWDQVLATLGLNQ